LWRIDCGSLTKSMMLCTRDVLLRWVTLIVAQSRPRRKPRGGIYKRRQWSNNVLGQPDNFTKREKDMNESGEATGVCRLCKYSRAKEVI
jgi:hypothetical protein